MSKSLAGKLLKISLGLLVVAAAILLIGVPRSSPVLNREHAPGSASAVETTPALTPAEAAGLLATTGSTPTVIPTTPATPTSPATPTGTATPASTTSPPSLTRSTETSDLLSQIDGGRAFQDISYQVGLGPRIPGSAAHDQVVSWLIAELDNAGWQTEVQSATRLGHPLKNIIARRGEGQRPWIILGAHYDTRLVADRDPNPDARQTPVPGANDGASGVAVLLEIARVLPSDLDGQVWLVFFDLEDNGDLAGWDWILGSRAFVDQLVGIPDAVVIVDMVADADLNIYLEGNSDQALAAEIWGQAAELGYSQHFIQSGKYSILDDHIPFIQAGIPSVDIIDFDYPYWHTIADTVDKVSSESLGVVARTILAWLLKRL